MVVELLWGRMVVQSLVVGLKERMGLVAVRRLGWDLMGAWLVDRLCVGRMVMELREVSWLGRMVWRVDSPV